MNNTWGAAYDEIMENISKIRPETIGKNIEFEFNIESISAFYIIKGNCNEVLVVDVGDNFSLGFAIRRDTKTTHNIIEGQIDMYQSSSRTVSNIRSVLTRLVKLIS